VKPVPRTRAIHATAFDATVAAALTVAMQASILFGDFVAGSKFVVAPLYLLTTVPLAWRRRAPLLVLILLLGAVVVQAVATSDAPEGGLLLIATAVAAYSVGAYAMPRGAITGAVLLAIGGLVKEAHNAGVQTPSEQWSAAFWWLIIELLLLAGIAVRRHREARALGQRAAQVEAERDERARVAVTEERARIARELHDIVSHNVSVMVIQAEAAEEVLDREPERAGEPLRRIQRSGREALTDMRRMLGVLRQDDGRSARSPTPGLKRLEALAADVREAGTPVTIRFDGEPRALSPALDLAAFRVVQEALTNVLKHAGPASAEVLIRYRDGAVEVEVLDDGQRVRSAAGSGQGLAGMRERVRVFGGDFEAGARGEGGFRVRASFPLS
jgi:signal transduction histidine kinase